MQPALSLRLRDPQEKKVTDLEETEEAAVVTEEEEVMVEGKCGVCEETCSREAPHSSCKV